LKKNTLFFLFLIIFLFFISSSFILSYKPGQAIGLNFLIFLKSMLGVLPAVFILIGLFEVWVPKEIIEKNMGISSGIRGYLWGMLLAGLTVGGLYVAFPIAHSLFQKNAKLSVIFFYVSASAVCRIPMSLFEASFLGIRFTIIRILIAIPIIMLSSLFLGKYLEKRKYQITTL
jgi:uncharacterized membrane protein YraQ (UPF0718 family)